MTKTKPKPAPKTKAPAAAFELVDPRTLKEWPDNPRDNDDAVDNVAASIARFGFADPIVARRANREIIAGHTRWKAATKLGLGTVPVRWMDLDEHEAHALALASNRLGEIADWSDEQLKAVLQELGSEEVKIDDLGWSSKQLAKLLGEETHDTAPQLGGLKFSVIIEVEDESAQAKVIAELEEQGYTCRPIIS